MIFAPDSKHTRPTTDRTRESMFNILNNYIDFDGILALDIYAGSGALGFEMLSRGAREVHFIEKQYQVYKNLAKNVSQLDVKNRCSIFKTHATSFTSQETHQKYDLIIADPPFFKYDIHQVTENILKNEFLTEEGILLIERSIQTQKEDTEAFQKEPFRRMGDTLLYMF